MVVNCKGNALISGKSRLVKYYSIWPDILYMETLFMCTVYIYIYIFKYAHGAMHIFTRPMPPYSVRSRGIAARVSGALLDGEQKCQKAPAWRCFVLFSSVKKGG